MKTPSACALLLLLPLSVIAAPPGPWQQITVPSVSETAAAFANPPKEYGAIHWATGFPAPKERIISDITNINANMGTVYMINSGGKAVKYLSPEYFDLMTVAMGELKKHGMKMWIDGDDGYPDGFAAGQISAQYPQLGMQGIVADARYTVAAGQTLDIPLPVDTLGIVASPHVVPSAAAAGNAAPRGTGRGRGGQAGGAPAAGGRGGARGRAAAPASTVPAVTHVDVPVPADGNFVWTAPSNDIPGGGMWDVTFDGSRGDARYAVASGQTLKIAVPLDTKSIQGNVRTRGGPGGGRGAAAPASVIIPVPADGQLKWTAPAGDGTWDVTFVRHVYRSSPTRYGQRADGTRDKDSLYSLIDYLDKDATAAYIKLGPEVYAAHYGSDMGTTILGFRGDETDYTGFIPWTPKLLATFKAQKGYDLQPYIAGFFAPAMTEETKLAYADYFDVWSGMFRDNFYKVMEDWCRAHGMDYMMHLNHEEIMVSHNGGEDMTKNEGSFFRDMRFMGVPGVDNLNQIGPGIVADFPKLAASAAHLYGRPQVWTEDGGTLSPGGKFVIDYQLVRGINFMNIRGLNAAPAANPDPALATGPYVTRSQYLLAIGRPAAQVALYIPTDSYWLNDLEADDATVKLTTELMEHQIDFDHIDHDALASVCTLEGGTLKNLSGQAYRAVVIPTSTVIQKNVLDRLRAFAAAGGKVIFVGRTPRLVVDKTFLHPLPGAPDLSFATLEPTTELTDRVIAALPAPDVKLDSPCAPLKYIHRNLKDGDVYFFFNESADTVTRTATVFGRGQAQVWDAASGKISPAPSAPAANGSVALPLTLGPQEARLIVIGPMPTVTAMNNP